MSFAMRITIVITLCASAYLIGIYTGHQKAWPLPQMTRLLEPWLESGIQTDRFGRLLRYPGKIEIPCPAQDAASAVLLVIGQSNAANYQGQRHKSADDNVVNFSEGRCYIAGSPLLGADGQYGESWTLLGQKLIGSENTKVVLIPAAVGASSVRQWAAGGDLNRMVLTVIRGAKTRYTITAILWHQGSTDLGNMSEEDYRGRLKSLIDTIRAEGVTAPFYISRSSRQLTPNWSEDNPIARAQASLADGKSIFAGPNTDHDVGEMDRFDGLHLSASGQEKFTDAWLRLLRMQQHAAQ